jgi:hypothetical protein
MGPTAIANRQTRLARLRLDLEMSPIPAPSREPADRAAMEHRARLAEEIARIEAQLMGLPCEGVG